MLGLGLNLTNVRVSRNSAPSLILDLFPNATAAYSLRKLRSAYSGSAIRVRRSSDNAEKDIGFASNVLDTSGLLVFIGANSGFVTTWYDQSGGNFNVENALAISQPRIVSSGSLLLVNSKPSIFFNNSFLTKSGSALSQPNTSLSVLKLNAITSGAFNAFVDGVAGRNLFYESNDVTPKFSMFAGTELKGSNSDLNQGIFNLLYNGGTSVLQRNDEIIAIGNAGTNAMRGITIGRDNSLINPSNMNMQEYILYNSNLSTNFAAMNTNINTFYNAY
jgi:hypothetical protein